MENLSLWIGGFIALLSFTCFVKIVTALSIFKYGVGLNGAGMGLVVFLFSLALSFLVISPQIEKAGGMDNILSAKFDENLERFKPLMEKRVDQKVLERFEKLQSKINPPQNDPTPVNRYPSALIAAFIVSELKDAFLIGFMVLVPFLVIDLLVVNVFALLGITQISAVAISLPLKLLLFVAVDGWTLISEKLLSAYVG